MTARLSKLAIVLTVIFLMSFVTLVAELFYLLWRRRRSRCVPTFPPDNATQSSRNTASAFAFFSSISSKRLLRFFCVNHKDLSRIEPKPVPLANLHNSTVSPAPDDEMEVEVIDVFKLQNMYGPPRFLFTIKEEDREIDLESDNSNSNSVCSSAVDKGTEKCSKRIISLLDDHFSWKQDDREIPPEVGTDEVHSSPEDIKFSAADEIEIITPFSTPCGSPPYYTPTASPARDSREVDDIENR